LKSRQNVSHNPEFRNSLKGVSELFLFLRNFAGKRLKFLEKGKRT